MPLFLNPFFFILVRFFILWQISSHSFYHSLFIILHLMLFNNARFQEEAC